jgi:hypothetical protein
MGFSAGHFTIGCNRGNILYNRALRSFTEAVTPNFRSEQNSLIEVPLGSAR